ncbi:hypothetical protein ABTF01_19770, partial [Acinetobacter baumannii]
AKRRSEMDARGDAAWQPGSRQRVVSQALQAYAALTTSADRGAVRDLSQLKRKYVGPSGTVTKRRCKSKTARCEPGGFFCLAY